jgi:hypothetical protein
MQLPFNQDEVRFISIDGNTVRFDLRAGHVEVTFDSREVMERVFRVKEQPSSDRNHVMYDGGIFGI